MSNVQTSAAGRASTTLNNPAQQEAALQRVRARHPAEEQLSTPTYKDRLEAIKIAGPYAETWAKECAAARTTGRISDKGIEALWELEPDRARELVSSSGLPQQEQRRIINQLPGQPLPAGTRAVALTMLVIEVVNDIAPLIQAQQVASFNENVRPGLQDIMWWQSKGVFPSMQGIKRNYLSSNEVTSDPARVQQMINSEDLSYLVLRGIDDKYWDDFTIWASTHIKNYRDWSTFITQSNAVQGKGDSIEELRWSYRTATLESAWIGYNIKERWVESDRLTIILRAAAKEMMRNTEQQIAGAANAPGGSHGQDAVSDRTQYAPTPAYDDKPKASGRKHFRQSASPILYTISGQKRCTGYSRDDVFYVFPNEAARGPVPAGYVVVGGADYNTYHEIYSTRNRITMVDRNVNGQTVTYEKDIEPNTLEVLLAKDSDLEDEKDTKDTK
jgi:hypothetical protein